MPEFAATIHLTSLDGTNGFQLSGGAAYDYSGVSVASAGDIDGDGFDDLIIGAPRSGVASVVLGAAGGFPARFELLQLDGTNGFHLVGETYGPGRVISVASAGDVNGDGLADMIVGSPSASAGGTSYVVYGTTASHGSTFDLSALDGTNGFRILGIGAGDRSGYSVASAGDVNGDGFDDLIIGAVFYGDPTGAAFVVFCQADNPAELNLSELDGSNGFRILGQQTFDYAGYSVASIGDINGDGFDDVVIGAPRADTEDANAGSAYVVFGKAGGFPADVDLAGLDGTNGFKLIGVDEGDYLGNSVASAGDVNGDGLDDLIVASYNAHIGGFDLGAAYVIFGRTSGFAATIDPLTLDGSVGYRITGNESSPFVREIGSSVASAGDVNGDGFDDVIVGAETAYGGGAAFVVFGRAGRPPSSVNVTSLDGSLGFKIIGAYDGGYGLAGHSVSSAGDLNGDGFDDLIVGAPGFSADDPDPSGKSYVIFGHRALEAVSRIGTNIGQTINGGIGNDNISGLAGDDRLLGWEGEDVLWGGLGDDVYVLEDIHGPEGPPFPISKQYDAINENPSEGIDGVRIRALNNNVPGPDGYILPANVENGIVTGALSFSLSGNELDNNLVGNRSFNALRGWAGNDRLSGGGGPDLLEGGTDDDIYVLSDISGSSGSFAFDSVGELLGEGIDLVRVAAQNINPSGADGYGLTDHVENGVVLGNFDFSLTGNGLTNRLTGNAADNRLSGLGGSDLLIGGLGRDVMIGGGARDLFDYNALAETGLSVATRDIINGFVHASDRLDLSDIDAIQGGAQDAFIFRGTRGFTAAGQVRAFQSGDHAIVELNTGGTLQPDATIQLTNVSAATLSVLDFVL